MNAEFEISAHITEPISMFASLVLQSESDKDATREVYVRTGGHAVIRMLLLCLRIE